MSHALNNRSFLMIPHVYLGVRVRRERQARTRLVEEGDELDAHRRVDLLAVAAYLDVLVAVGRVAQVAHMLKAQRHPNCVVKRYTHERGKVSHSAKHEGRRGGACSVRMQPLNGQSRLGRVGRAAHIRRRNYAPPC